MAVDHNNPQSRDEEILIATIDGTEYNKLPQSRMEELLLELKEVIEEGGSGGGGIRPVGVTTTPLYDGATTNPIQINGESYTAETGDMVTYQSTEFLFNVNEVWQELGDVSEVLEIIDDIFADIAPAFDATSTYAVGDYVIYNDLLYRCTTAHTGAWAAADFTATSLSDEIKNNKGTEYTAGKYININANNEISVDPVVPNEAFTYTIKQIDDYSFEIIKTVDNVDVFDEVYSCYDPVAQQQRDVNETFDDAINIHIYPAGERSYTLLIASDTHEAGFKQTTPWYQRNTFVETFSTVDHSGEKLIIKSELDSAIGAIKDGQSIDSFADVETALAGKQDTLTAGNNIKIDNNAISVNRWFVPAGKVVYTVITSDENYGQNIHIQRHTTGGDFIDDRVYTVGTWQTATIDSLIYIEERYTKFYIELLKNSDEQSAGYNYIVDPNTKSTSNSFTFLMDQEENDNDLIIRSELDAEVGAIKDGTSIDSFADVETALTSKQNVTDNTLQTTDKTVPGAINELKSGLTNLSADVKLNTQDLTTVSRSKNLAPFTLDKLKAQNTTGTWSGNTYEYNGIVWTINTNSAGQVTSVVGNGTANGMSLIELWAPYKAGSYIINGAPADTPESGSYYLQFYANHVVDKKERGSGVTATLASDATVVVRPIVPDTIQLSNVTFYPMVRLATETDATFAPYIPSVESRIEAVESGLTNVTTQCATTTASITINEDLTSESWYPCVVKKRNGYCYLQGVLTVKANKSIAKGDIILTINDESFRSNQNTGVAMVVGSESVYPFLILYNGDVKYMGSYTIQPTVAIQLNAFWDARG